MTDPGIPFLPAALDPAAAEPLLRAACGPAAGGPLRAVRLARHKPGRRCLVEYDFGSVTLIGKVRAKGADRGTYELMRRLRAAGFGDDSPDGVSVPEPVGIVPELGMWVQRKVPGVPATRLLAGAGGVVLARRVAEATHKLHRADVPAARRHTVADELDILAARLGDLARERPGWARRLGRLYDACARLAADTPAGGRGGAHRDFYPDQVLVAGSRLYLLDFDLYCEADPALDAGNFLGHLTEFASRALGRAEALDGPERAFEDRFAELAGEAARPAVRAYALLTLARHVGLSTRFPHRRPFAERLLELCEGRLKLTAGPRPTDSCLLEV